MPTDLRRLGGAQDRINPPGWHVRQKLVSRPWAFMLPRVRIPSFRLLTSELERSQPAFGLSFQSYRPVAQFSEQGFSTHP